MLTRDLPIKTPPRNGFSTPSRKLTEEPFSLAGKNTGRFCWRVAGPGFVCPDCGTLTLKLVQEIGQTNPERVEPMNVQKQSGSRISHTLFLRLFAAFLLCGFTASAIGAAQSVHAPLEARPSTTRKAFTKSEIIELIKLDTPDPLLLSRISAAGISFVATQEDMDDLAKLGASNALLAAIQGASSRLEAQIEATPMERQELMRAISEGKLSENELIAKIERRRLAFQMTTSDEDAFRQAGAKAQLLEILWRNDAFKVSPGDPLTIEQVLSYLHEGIPSQRVILVVQERKARIALNKTTAEQITEAGGSESLIVAILSNLTGEENAAAATSDVSHLVENAGNAQADARSEATICIFHSQTSAAWEATRVYVDGEFIARLHNGRYLCFNQSLGLHHIVAGRAALSLTIQTPGKFYLESSIGWNDHVRLVNYPAYLTRYKRIDPKDIANAKTGMDQRP